MLNNLSQNLIGAIVDAVDRVSSSVLSDMLSNSPTNKTSSAMKISQTATYSGNQVKAVIEIDLSKAPEALAYEYGSGIHSEKGEKKKYPIRAKNANAMVFDWKPPWVSEQTYNLPWISFDGSKGTVMFNKNWTLMHPGVAARPYIRPALLEAKKQIPILLSRRVMEAFRASVTIRNL